MIIDGRAIVVPGDNIDTDVLYPGPFLNIDTPEEMKVHLFDGLDPSLRDRFGGDTVLVVGDNFGVGSSREHVPLAMKAWGVRAVLGVRFARIFFRNCINLGLPAISCRAAVAAAAPDSAIQIVAHRGEVSVDGRRFETTPLPEFVIDMVDRGGLVPWVRRRLSAA